MGIFDKFFIIEEDAPKKLERPIAQVNATPVYVRNEPVDNSKFTAHFMELFHAQNLEGPDYHEFYEMMEAMPKTMSEEVKVSSCFAALSAMKLSKDLLLSTAKHYIDAIIQDEKEFMQAISDKIKNDVGAKQLALDKAKLEIIKMKAEISRISKDIEAEEASIDPMAQDIADETSKIEVNKGAYESACKAMTDRILNDITTIKETIK